MTDTVWYECGLCGAKYRGRQVALLCCGWRFDNLDSQAVVEA